MRDYRSRSTKHMNLYTTDVIPLFFLFGAFLEIILHLIDTRFIHIGLLLKDDEIQSRALLCCLWPPINVCAELGNTSSSSRGH